MKESVKESTTKWAEIKTTVSAYRDLSNNKGFQTKEWLPQEIMSKKYPTESLNEKWKWNLGDSDKLAFSNLFSKDILIFIILGFSGRKRTTLCQLLIKKKKKEWAGQNEDLRSTQSFVISAWDSGEVQEDVVMYTEYLKIYFKRETWMSETQI